jgi:plastocyanin
MEVRKNQVDGSVSRSGSKLDRDKHKIWLVAGVAVVLLAVAFLFLYNPSRESFAGKAIATTAAIDIRNFAFTPGTVTINTGDRVVWTNNDRAPHTVTSAPSGPLDSGVLTNGQTFSYTFNNPGTFGYVDESRAGMSGTIIVVGEAVVPTAVVNESSSNVTATTVPEVPTMTDESSTPEVPETMGNQIQVVTVNPALVSSASTSLNFTVGGPGASNCSVYLNRTDFARQQTINALAIGSHSFNLVLANGSYVWNVVCVDAINVGNNATSANGTFSVRVIPDETVPNALQVSLIAPVNDADIGVGTATFNYSFTGASLATCDLQANFSGSFRRESRKVRLPAGSHSFTLPVGEGSFLWNVFCIDETNQSNDGRAEINFTIRVGSVNLTDNLTFNASNVSNSTGNTSNGTGSSNMTVNATGNLTNLTSNMTENTTNGSEIVSSPCVPNWSCTEFSACQFGRKTRTCTDANSCGSLVGRPPSSEICVQDSVAVTPPSVGAPFQADVDVPAARVSNDQAGRVVSRPERQEPKSSNAGLVWGVIVVVILLGLGGAGYYLYMKKGGSPEVAGLKKYVERDRARGVADDAIKNNLLRVGWKPKDVDKAMK